MLEPIISALKRHRWLAILAFLIPFTGAAVLAWSLPGLYRATATILVQREADRSSAGPPATPADVEARLRTVREEILSRQRLDEMVERFGLYAALRRQAPREAIINRMRKDIQIQANGPEQGSSAEGTIAFSLSFRGGDRFLVASVANSLAESYVQENLRIRGRQASSAAGELKAQLSDVRARLDEQEDRIDAYQAAHNGELPQQLVVNLARMQQLEMQLQLVRDRRLRAAERREIVGETLLDSRSGETSGSPESSEARLERLRRELADLRMTYNDKYPDVIRKQSEIATLESRLREAPAAPPGPRPKSVRARTEDGSRDFDVEEARLRSQIDTYRARVDRAPLREQEFAKLSRDYSTTKDLYSSLLLKYQEARIADDLERENTGGQLRILDAAIPPSAPFAPNRNRLLLFALMASLAFAAAAVALADRLDTSFHSVDDLRAFTRVPVLVSIPPLNTRSERWRGRRQFALMTLVTLTGILLVGAATWTLAHGNIDLAQLLARGSAS